MDPEKRKRESSAPGVQVITHSIRLTRPVTRTHPGTRVCPAIVFTIGMLYGLLLWEGTAAIGPLSHFNFPHVMLEME